MQQLPVAVRGALAYGGSYHGLLVGSFFAGACILPSEGIRCELYYVDARLADDLVRFVVERGGGSTEALAGPWPTPRETFRVRVLSIGDDNATSFIRLLLALPPQTPPPQQPLAVYTVTVRGLAPCRAGRLLCREEGVAQDITIADIYVHTSILGSWVEEEGGYLDSMAINMGGRNVFVVVPLGETG